MKYREGLVHERGVWVRRAVGGCRCGLNWRDSCGLVGRDASYAGAFCSRNRFLGRDASYEEALYERNRFGERRFA